MTDDFANQADLKLQRRLSLLWTLRHTTFVCIILSESLKLPQESFYLGETTHQGPLEKKLRLNMKAEVFRFLTTNISFIKVVHIF